VFSAQRRSPRAAFRLKLRLPFLEDPVPLRFLVRVIYDRLVNYSRACRDCGNPNKGREQMDSHNTKHLEISTDLNVIAFAK